MPVIRRILDFLELRQVFTLRLAQVFWWLYIGEQLYSARWGFYRVVTARGPASWLYNWFEALFTPVRVLVALATARILIEVFLAILWPSDRRRSHAGPSLGSELLAFLDLRPFFTRWWLQLFWWLYLLTFLHALYLNTHIGSVWLATATPSDWIRLLRGLLVNLVWLAGVRLLVEVALKMQPPEETPSRQTGP